MSNTELEARLQFVHFDDSQRRALARAQPRIERLLSAALDRFYETAGRTPETAAFFRDRGHMAKAKAAQEGHWARLASGRFDADYHESVRRIGATHARIGLEPRWYVGAYCIVLEGLVRGLAAGASPRLLGRRDDSIESIVAVVKAALLDMELSISVYFDNAEAERNAAMKALEAREAELTSLLESIGGSADRLRTGAAEIAQASEDLARRTESNAASLEETSAALAQIDGRLKAGAAASRQTVQRADQALATVDDGRSTAGHAVDAMGRVSESAKGIDTVIEGLDKIAFQTRVLAMNAAVEAGRAGEAGRGFAVVADLVSALAMRAEEEAKRARDQLTVTQSEIVSAVDAVTRVDGALQRISEDVGEVHGLLGTMATDNQAQATAITQISAAVGAMDQATQQNAAMVEQTSAAARNLSNEVDTLAEQAGQFRTAGGSGSRGAAPKHFVPAKPRTASASNGAGYVSPVAALPGGPAGGDEWKDF